VCFFAYMPLSVSPVDATLQCFSLVWLPWQASPCLGRLSSCKLSLQPGPMQTWGRLRWAGGYNSCRNLGDLGRATSHHCRLPPCIHSALCWDVWTWFQQGNRAPEVQPACLGSRGETLSINGLGIHVMPSCSLFMLISFAIMKLFSVEILFVQMV
jgi:hypothetical protein